MNEETYQQVIARLRGFPTKRAESFIESLNDRIKRTKTVDPTADDLPMSALARRLYLYALIEGKRHNKENAKDGVASPQHAIVQRNLAEFAKALVLPGIDPPSVVGDLKLVGNFCTHKVTGVTLAGFFVLVALFIWHRETEGGFNIDRHLAMVPESEVKLSFDIGTFFARRLNEEAKSEKSLPFPEVRPARPETGLSQVSFYYLQDDDLADKVRSIFEDFRTPRTEDKARGDGNAHLILYRGRKSKPNELIKSFLIVQPQLVHPRNDRERHHSTVHFYRAPHHVGGTERSAPGRILPLSSGLFILGAQHNRPSRRSPGYIREAAEPFRSLELIYFPWENLENSLVIGGIALTMNNTGEPLIARICARPTLFLKSDHARLGSVPIEELEADIELDRAAEEALRATSSHPDPQNILAIYQQFGEGPNLANRISELCNNSSNAGWDVVPGYTKEDGTPVMDSDLESIFKAACSHFQHPNGKPFDPQRDLRIAPLVTI